jgi:putative PIN family toxin of toxin-antitoxin system
MKSWVLDTNVIVAAHLSPFGPPGRLLAEIYARRLRLSYDARIAAEYREVLLRPKFSLPPDSVKSFLRVLEDQDPVIAPPLNLKLPDPDDLMFLEVAAITGERVLVTGNPRHFPAKSCHSIRVLTPAEAWSVHVVGSST